MTGQKNWITWGGDAHVIVVFARTSQSKGSDGISAFLVDAETPGFVSVARKTRWGATELRTTNCSTKK